MCGNTKNHKKSWRYIVDFTDISVINQRHMILFFFSKNSLHLRKKYTKERKVEIMRKKEKKENEKKMRDEKSSALTQGASSNGWVSAFQG